MTTLYWFVFVAISLVLIPAVGARLLQLGASWLSAPPVAFHRALMMVLIIPTLALMALRFLAGVQFDPPATKIFFAIILIAVALAIFGKLLRTKFWHGVGIALFALVPAVAWLTFAKFYLCDAYVVPTNSMSPTLLGPHWTATCPKCGGPAFGTPRHSREDEGDYLVCEREMRMFEDPGPEKQLEGQLIGVSPGGEGSANNHPTLLMMHS